MEIISSNAPYIIEVARYYKVAKDPLGTYNIYLGSTTTSANLIYTGQVATDTSLPRIVEVDLQPILVNYTNNYLSDLQNYGESYETAGDELYTEVTVVYDGTEDTSVTKSFYMIYCSENATNKELGFAGSDRVNMPGNSSIQNKYVAGTYFSLLTISSYIDDGVSMSIILTDDEGVEESIDMTYDMKTQRSGGILPVKDNTKSFSISIDGDLFIKDMEVVHCLPENSFILYYVNTLGGIDWLICDKKNKLTYNADRHSITRYATIQDRTKFGTLNYLNNTTKTWSLNTDILTDEQSKQMYKVFNSPYVWLYDCDKQEIDSVVIEDSSLTIKRFETDKVFNYSITVKSSQTFTIR